ncbi:hypothetical protein K9K77_02620 [Candidatus Babeliales bacterium]|nr:hypothetical protein [Candidatus Babeliales bacterium]
MNKKYCYFLLYGSLISTFQVLLNATQLHDKTTVKNILNTKIKEENNTKEKMVWFRYNDVPLATIVNELATQLNINIMLPSGANALTTKVTFEFSHKISLHKAWQYVITLLKISGFTIIPRVGFSTIVKNDANTNKESLPLFVNTPTASLPKTDLKIRYLRYLSNIQVPGGQSTGGYGGGAGQNPLETILKDILSADAQLIFEPQLNAMVLTDYATNIKSVMEIVDQLDSSSIVQDMQIFRLEHTSATYVKALFDQLIGTQQAGSGGQAQVPNNSGFFAQTTKIIPIIRTNSLVFLGKKDALTRILTFIKEHVDTPHEEGKSLLHVYDLKYLKADDFATTLRTIVQGSDASSGGSSGYGSGTNQSSSSTGSQTKLYFEGVIIAAETSAPGTGASGGDGTVQQGSQGGNRLIIAALERDWIRLEKLIKELDQPRLQVAIQGLIVDLITTRAKSLASQIRNHSSLFFKDDINMQAAHIANTYQTPGTPSNALQSNLLAGVGTLTSGNTVISVTDPGINGIWLITQMLQSSSDNKILSQPYLTTTNHKQVSFTSSETRYVQSTAEATSTTGTTINYGPKEASLIVNVLPTISENGIINLGLSITVDEFTGNAKSGAASEGDTANRKITTNANIYSGDILVIGGLSKTTTIVEKTGTPGLDKVPFIKHFVSSNEQTVTTSELMIFLRAEVIYTSHQDSNKFTRYKSEEALDLLGLTDNRNDNLSQLRDPITHWFFGNEKKQIAEAMQNYQNNIEANFNKIPAPLFKDKKNDIKPIKITAPLHSMPEIQENIQSFSQEESPEKKSPEKLEKLSESAEEKQAEKELKKLFHFNAEVVSEKINKEIEKKTKELKIIEKKPISSAKKTPLAEEAKAQKELQALFQYKEKKDLLLT